MHFKGLHFKSVVRLSHAPLALAYWAGVAGTRLREGMSPRILMWHGIPGRLAAQFERQLRFLRRHFHVVPLGALAETLRDGGAGAAGKVALTFDDGLRNNATVAYPILRKLGLPATFFVCAELAETGCWLWNQEMRQRLARLDAAALARLAHALGMPGTPAEDLIGWMKALPLAERRRVEDRVRAATRGFAPTEEEREQFDVARWKDLLALDPEVITIGSHTLTHPILPSLPPGELEREVGASRRELEGRLRRPVDLFAYPNGDQNAMVRDCARRHYRAAVTASGSEVGPDCDPHLLPREATPAGAIRLAWAMHRLPG